MAGGSDRPIEKKLMPSFKKGLGGSHGLRNLDLMTNEEQIVSGSFKYTTRLNTRDIGCIRWLSFTLTQTYTDLEYKLHKDI